jgi:TrmH family RNA methyltransferase
LEEIQDPANLGTVLRTAEALGEKAVLLCGKGCDPYSPKVLRGSMGAVFRLPMISIPNFAEAAPLLKKCGWTLWAAVPDSDALRVTKADFSNPSVMAVGNEGNGLSKETIALCQPVTIPMLGRAESLNASASAAILLWEMMRGGTSRE